MSARMSVTYSMTVSYSDTFTQLIYSDSNISDVLEEMPELTIPEGATVWETDVLIVGCGPTGLTLANEVGQRGVDTTIIDMRQHVLPDSRFFNLMYTTVEGLKKIGVMSKVRSSVE